VRAPLLMMLPAKVAPLALAMLERQCRLRLRTSQ
jgi:hypothetical protein